MLGIPQTALDNRHNYIFGPAQPNGPIGTRNVGVGEIALYSLGSGAENVAFGDQTCWQLLDANRCTGFGSLALYTARSGLDFTALGTAALHLATGGNGTTAAGRMACFAVAKTEGETAVGDSALRFHADGSENVAAGFRAAENLREASGSVLVGGLVALGTESSHRCVALGFDAMSNGGSTPLSDNVVLGCHSYAFSQAQRGVGIGAYSGLGCITGTGNIFVGAESGVSSTQATAVDNSVGFGAFVSTTASHQVALGNAETSRFDLGSILFTREQLEDLLALAGSRSRPLQTGQSSSTWLGRLRARQIPAQGTHDKPPAPPMPTPVLEGRRRCLTTLMAGALAACGGGQSDNHAQAGDAPDRARALRAPGGATTNNSADSSCAPPTLGNPQVPADGRRNYVFGPVQIASTESSAVANVGVGEAVLGRITTGWANTAVGDNAMCQSETAINCVAIGSVAMFAAVQTIDCTAVGAGALQSARDGVGGTAIGRLAAASLTSANNNTAVGAHAMRLSVSGVGNTAFGYKAAESNFSGSGSVVMGAHAARWMPNGDRNVVVGFYAMGDVRAETSDNVAVGAQALFSTTGGRNTAVGTNAGLKVTTGSSNVFIGFGAGAGEQQRADVSNSIAIGAGACTTQSHQVVIGNDRTELFVFGDVVFTKAQLRFLAALSRRELAVHL